MYPKRLDNKEACSTTRELRMKLGKNLRLLGRMRDLEIQIDQFLDSLSKASLAFNHAIGLYLDIVVGPCGEFRCQPVTTLLAISAFVPTRLERVQEQQDIITNFPAVLNKSTGIGWDLWKSLLKRWPVVVVAHQQTVRHRQFVQAGANHLVGTAFSAIGKVTGRDAQLGIRRILINVSHALAQPIGRFEAMQSVAVWCHVQVGNLNESHVGALQMRLRDKRRYLDYPRLAPQLDARCWRTWFLDEF